MKTVIIDIEITTTADNNGDSTFKKERAQYSTMIGRRLNKQGFDYVGSLNRLYTKKQGKYTALRSRITFEDVAGEGKTSFMSAIRRTGLLGYGSIVKTYS